MTAYKQWLDTVVELCGPIADTDSLKWVISNEIMRLNSTKDRVAKIYFVKVLRKFAANQLAAATVNEIKAEQEAKLAAAKLAEETAQLEKTALNGENKETTGLQDSKGDLV